MWRNSAKSSYSQLALSLSLSLFLPHPAWHGEQEALKNLLQHTIAIESKIFRHTDLAVPTKKCSKLNMVTIVTFLSLEYVPL